jgi:O-antigen ligase
MRTKLAARLQQLSWFAFLATIILTPFRIRIELLSRPVPPVWKDYTDFLLFASDLAMLSTLALWGAGLLVERRQPKLQLTFVGFTLAGLTLTAGFTAPFSIDPALSVYHFVRLCALFAFFLYILDNVKNLGQLVPAIALQALIQSGVAIAQALAQHSVGLQALGEYELDPAWQGVSVVFTATTRTLRAYGLSDHPNILGGMLAFSLVLLFAHACSSTGRSRLWALVALAPGAAALFFTFSRSAWLGLLCGLGLLAYFVWRQAGRRGLLRAAAVLTLMTAVTLPFAWQNRELLGIRLGAGGSFTEIPSELGSIGERRVLVDAGNRLFQMHPLTGIGMGGTPQAFLKEFPNFPVSYQPVHFVILNSAVETGLFGAVIYLGLLVGPWAVLYTKRRMALNLDLVAAFALLTAITVIGFFDYYTWLLVPGRLWQWLAWGLWAKFSLLNE